MIKLTDEDMLKAINRYPAHRQDDNWRLSDRELEQCIRVAQAQLDKVIEAVKGMENPYEWHSKEPCKGRFDVCGQCVWNEAIQAVIELLEAHE